ncbi:MAG: hypothetical protein IPM55_09595 [Acidobacteria bacterium]|nr:hypothetical protein [Acidobacteriota bacterium]
MFRNTYLKIIIGSVIVIAILGLLRYKPWQRDAGFEEDAERAQLNVGFLPVT